MLFDTHLHLIYKNRLSYPWLNNLESLNKDNPISEYSTMASRLGIGGCFHMEVDVAENQIEAEIDVISELADDSGGLMQGIIASCRPEKDDFPAFLDRVRSRKFLRGFRRVLHVVPDDLSTSMTFRDNVKRLGGTGLTFDLCVMPRQLRLARELVDHCPEVLFVLDHCGVPNIVAGAMTPWCIDISALAERDNVYAKISGVIAYGNPDTWSLNDLRPFVEHTVDVFGTDRIVWGSDSPVCNLGGGLPLWVAATHALTEGWSTDERGSFYNGNTARLWGLSS